MVQWVHRYLHVYPPPAAFKPSWNCCHRLRNVIASFVSTFRTATEVLLWSPACGWLWMTLARQECLSSSADAFTGDSRHSPLSWAPLLDAAIPGPVGNSHASPSWWGSTYARKNGLSRVWPSSWCSVSCVELTSQSPKLGNFNQLIWQAVRGAVPHSNTSSWAWLELTQSGGSESGNGCQTLMKRADITALCFLSFFFFSRGRWWRSRPGRSSAVWNAAQPQLRPATAPGFVLGKRDVHSLIRTITPI